MIIFISGSLGAGKTTTADLLAKSIDKGSLMDQDVFSKMMGYSMNFEEYLPHTNALAVSTIRYLHNIGRNVVVPGSITNKHYLFLKETYADLWNEIFIICLNPDKEIVLAGRGDRKLSEWEKQRVTYHYENGATNLPESDFVIDTGNISAKETADKIMKYLLLKTNN